MRQPRLADGNGSAETLPAAPGYRPWSPPDTVERGVLVLHGTGMHAPLTTLTEILDPTLERMRAERTLVGIHPCTAGDPTIPGGKFDGLYIEYTRKAMAEHAVPAPEDIRTMLVVEGRWDGCFLEPPLPIVSAWAAARVAPMAWELFKYHVRSLAAFTASMLTLLLLTAGLVLGLGDHAGRVTSASLFASGLFVAFLAALSESYRAWDAQRRLLRRSDPTGRVPSRWWIVPPAFTTMVYYVQRSLVLVSIAAGMLLLPALTFFTRLLATMPGINRLAGGAVTSFERFALGQAATDIEVISQSYVSASAIQARAKAGLREIQTRLRPGSEITVLAHSAGAPLAWWLLSEPGIHYAERTERFRYRLITVGGALNWARRGMQCDATALDWPLVAAGERVGAAGGAGNRAAALTDDKAPKLEPVLWLNLFSTWDPAPHGPIRASDYAGPWQIIETLEDALAPAASEQARPRGVADLLRRVIALCSSPERANTTSADGQRCGDPNVPIRNLGSPVSAEHSEYFRNQQEFVPLLVHCIDPEIEWVKDEVTPKRREQWSNLRLALISPLVRLRMVIFALPVAYLALMARGDGASRLCGAGFQGAAWIRSAISKTGFIDPGSACSNIWAVDLAITVLLALFAFAAVEAYTNICWSSLGRSIGALDWREESSAPRMRSRSWRPGGMAPWPMLVFWLPVLVAPLLLVPFNVGPGLYALVAINAALCVAEAFWCSHLLRGLRDPDARPETWIRHGRRADYPVAL